MRVLWLNPSVAFNTFDSLAKLVVHTLEQILVVCVDLRHFAQQLVLNPLLVQNDLLSVEVFDGCIDTAQLRTLIELHGQVDDLANMSLSFDLCLFGRPRGAFHKLFAFHGLRSQDVFGTSQSTVQPLIFLDQHASLAFDFIISKWCLHFECGVVVGCVHLTAIALS